jgi:hypothetical protein
MLIDEQEFHFENVQSVSQDTMKQNVCIIFLIFLTPYLL